MNIIMKNTLHRLGVKAAIVGTSIFPLLASAQSRQPTGGLQVFITRVQAIFNQLIPLLLVMALFWFLYGIVLFIMSDIDDREKGRTIMIHGIIALFVMTTVWGLVGFVGDTVGIRSEGVPDVTRQIPQIIPPNNPR